MAFHSKECAQDICTGYSKFREAGGGGRYVGMEAKSLAGIPSGEGIHLH